MNAFNNLPFRSRLMVLSLPLALLVFAVVAIAVHRIQVAQIHRNLEPLMEQHLSNLSDLVTSYNQQSSFQTDFAKRLINDLQARLRVSAEDTLAVGIKWRLLKQAEGFEKHHQLNSDYFNFEELKESFYSKRYYKTGFAYLIDAKGYFVIHPSREQENVLTESFFREMQEKRKGIIQMYDEKLMTEVLVFYNFDIENENYVCIAVPRSEFIDLQVNSVDRILWLIGLMLIAALLVSLLLFSNNLFQPLNFIDQTLGHWLQGQLHLQPYHYPYNDTIRSILQKLKIFAQQLTKLQQFADGLQQGNYHQQLDSLGPDDQLSASLLAMQDLLQRNVAELQARQNEDGIRIWEANSLARFNDLMRQSGQAFDAFGYTIIKGLAEYVNANLGGLYVYDQKDFSGGLLADELVLVASHAYEQKKFLDRRFKTGEGLVGVCASEMKTVFMTEVPADYLKIRSGLGDSHPKSLLFVPILLENAPFGVIELAALHVFRPYEISFVEKIATTLATTLANVKNSIRTQELLRESQNYTEQMRLQEEIMRAQIEQLDDEKTAAENELERLKKKESRASLLFDKSVLPMMITDEKGQIIVANHAALQLFGLENEATGDITIQELIIIKDMKHFFSRLGQWQRVKAIHMEGKITPIEVYMNLVSGRGEKIMLVFIRNVSRLASLENELKRQREDNQLLQNRITELKKELDRFKGE